MIRSFVAFALLLGALSACGGGGPSPTPTPSAVVARVGTTSITQAQIDLRLKSALTALQQAGAATPASSSDPMLASLRASVLRSLIMDAVIAQEAQFRNVAISDADVETEVQQDVTAVGGMDTLQTQLAEAGGSLDQLRDEIRSRRNEQNVEDLFAQARATDAEKAITQGGDFAAIASQYSDDDSSRGSGGAVANVSVATLAAGDKAFNDAVMALGPGKVTLTPVRDQAGYEILRLDAATPTTRSFHRILIAAPQPYTIKERPAWFNTSLLSALATLCSSGQVTVLIDVTVQPCTASPAPATSGSPVATSPTPTR